jgi:serine/threonine protein phosphatase PrpC
MGTPPLKVGCTTRAGEKPVGQNDDRCVIRQSEGLFLIADASGPTYGGYYHPIGTTEAIQAVVDGLVAAPACDDGSPLRAGIDAAHTLLNGFEQRWRTEFEVEVKMTPNNRLDASLRASRTVAKACFGRDLNAFVHFALSITALYFTKSTVTVGQIGSCRAYRVRDGQACLLLSDHSLATMTGEPDQASVCVRLLGAGTMAEAQYRTESVAPGDVYVLLTDGVWTELATEDVARLVAAGREGEPDELAVTFVAAAVGAPTADASAVVVLL